jgi:hypothetical protein
MQLEASLLLMEIKVEFSSADGFLPNDIIIQ